MAAIPLAIRRSTEESHGNGNRVTALADGLPVWFECDTRPLSGVGEVFGSALFVPALQRDRQLHIEDPVSPRWHENLPHITTVMAEWWGMPQYRPVVSFRSEDLTARTTGAMLCFSAGVDAFHTLLCSKEPVRHLITMHGFDIPLSSKPLRWNHLDTAVRRAASDLGLPLTIIRTNLREHPIFRCETWQQKAAFWQRSLGGALATIAHLMRDHGDRLLISSSFTPAHDVPWGTHWRLDPYWSSEAVTVRHYGEQYHRGAKVRAIAYEPVVQRNLHVCVQHHADNLGGNCSRCEKCVRTMVVLDQCDALQHFTAFAPPKPLIELIDDLPGPDAVHEVLWQDIIADGLRPDMRSAIERLLHRPAPVSHPPRWWKRMERRVRHALRGKRPR